MKTDEQRIPHYIYGYRAKVGKRSGQWKIGCTMQSEWKNRHASHQRGRSSCRLFDRYTKARMREGYSFEEIWEYFQLRVFVCTRRDAEQWERIYTERYDALAPNGFCLMTGMYNGKASEESRRLMSESRKGRTKENNEGVRRTAEKNKGKKHTKERCKNMSNALKGRKGKKLSEETKRKISKALKGKKHTEETKRKMSKARKGKKQPNISKALKGKKQPNVSKALKGKKLSKEHCENISKAKKGKPNLKLKGKRNTKEHCQNISKARKGKPWSSAQRAAHSKRSNNQTQILPL